MGTEPPLPGLRLQGGSITQNHGTEPRGVVRGISRELGEAESRSQGSFCKGRDGPSDVRWSIGQFPRRNSEGRVFRKRKQQSQDVRGRRAHLAGTLRACRWGRRVPWGLTLMVKNLPQPSVRPLGGSKPLRAEGGAASGAEGIARITAFPACPDMDIQGGSPARRPAWWKLPRGSALLPAGPLPKGPELGRTLVTRCTLT